MVNWFKKTRLQLDAEGGFSYAFRTTRMNSVTKSNAIKSFIVMGLELTAYPQDSTTYIIS